MTTLRIPSKEQIWSASLTNLSMAYGRDRDEMESIVYAVAEHLHNFYCLSRGQVNHTESRPDQHAALAVLMALAGNDLWVFRGAEVAEFGRYDQTEG